MTEKGTVRSSSPELSSMLLPQLKEVATQLGVEGANKLKKDALVQAISDLQAANREAAKLERETRRAERNNNRNKKREAAEESEDERPSSTTQTDERNSESTSERGYSDGGDRDSNSRRGRDRDRGRDRERGRDRSNRDRAPREEREPVLSEDDVLVPVGGLVDIMESYAFIRTGGYLPGPNDVYISLQQVRRYALRKGDVVTGAVRQPRDGERREKFNALMRLDTINGMQPEEARNRVEFAKLVPLYPQERLRFNFTNRKRSARTYCVST